MLRGLILRAFDDVRDGYAVDRVIADPELNQRFLAACANIGLTETAYQLNLTLLNIRKNGQLRGLLSRRTLVSNLEEFTFASEIAIRFLVRRDAVTLDQVICDPARAAEFDLTASRIAPGYSSFQYRWAALSLRKRGRIPPEVLASAIRPESTFNVSCRALDLNQVDGRQGLYLFFSGNSYLYAGEAKNLGSRLRTHLDHSDNRGLARWIWEHGDDELHLEIRVLPADTPTKVRKAMELELIRSNQPAFNVAGNWQVANRTGQRRD